MFYLTIEVRNQLSIIYLLLSLFAFNWDSSAKKYTLKNITINIICIKVMFLYGTWEMTYQWHQQQFALMEIVYLKCTGKQEQ